MGNDVSNPDEFAFQGRTAREYSSFFDLNTDDWTSILDCGAGPSSFTATVREETPVIAVDPAYQAPVSELRTRSQSSIDGLRSTFSGIRDQFVWTFYTGTEERIAYLERARERFLQDITGSPGNYVAGALPSLPFQADAFDLALSAHFLFLYGDQLGEPFHREALAELCRVARKEVRVYPLFSLAGWSGLVDPLISWLDNAGHDVGRRDVPFEFYQGANEMLVIAPE